MTKGIKGEGPFYILQNDSIAAFYNRLWALSMPSKIKILLWKINNGYVSTRSILKGGRLVQNDHFPVCEVERESISHLFHNYSFTIQVLEGVGFRQPMGDMCQDWQ